MPKMPGLPGKLTPAKVGGLWRFWKMISAVSVQEIAAEAERPVQLALIGTPDQTRLLAARLALETPVPRDSPHGPADIGPYVAHYADAREAPEGSIALDADALTADEARLAETLARIVVDHPDLRLALARRVPAFRPAVAAQLINEVAWENARMAVISALPGIVPLTDLLLPAASLGDMVLLTRNQLLLLLRIAAAYGQEVNLRARVRELLPVVGGAFGWRALARELLGLVPGGIGVVIKGSVAYAGTYTVGKGAAIFYSTGQTLSDTRLKQLYRAAFKDALARVRHLPRREKAPATSDVAEDVRAQHAAPLPPPELGAGGRSPRRVLALPRVRRTRSRGPDRDGQDAPPAPDRPAEP
ncbi:MAG: hypothetical protein JO250_22955 [Armatimonadetes bacterium]|nr:hypothetical protein [Armatimonadota bacterium]